LKYILLKLYKRSSLVNICTSWRE